jgi:hypothetical protein
MNKKEKHEVKNLNPPKRLKRALQLFALPKKIQMKNPLRLKI